MASRGSSVSPFVLWTASFSAFHPHISRPLFSIFLTDHTYERSLSFFTTGPFLLHWAGFMKFLRIVLLNHIAPLKDFPSADKTPPFLDPSVVDEDRRWSGQSSFLLQGPSAHTVSRLKYGEKSPFPARRSPLLGSFKDRRNLFKNFFTSPISVDILGPDWAHPYPQRSAPPFLLERNTFLTGGR